MYFANFSHTAKVTRHGIIYPNFFVNEAGQIEQDHLLIPFEEFDETDFVQLESGNLLLLAQFELQKTLGGDLVMVKGNEHDGFLLVMCSFLYDKDAVVFSTPFSTAPEKVYRFETKMDTESNKMHDYLFVIHKSKEYVFGYYSKVANKVSEINLKWDYAKDELHLSISKPIPFNLDFDFDFD